MKNNIQRSAFILLAIGTVGLLLNEFAMAWGRSGTLIFATANIIGLILLGLALGRNQ